MTAHVGGRLRRLRQSRRLSRQDVARRSGISLTRLERIESGWFDVSIDEVFCLCAVLNTTIEQIWPDAT